MSPIQSSKPPHKPIELLPFDERALELPPMPDDVFDELVGDMKRRGFRPQFPIIVHNGKIIDGVNRARASVKAGVEPVYQQFDGKDEDVDRFIIQANLCRRHLKPEEKRALLKKLLKVSPEQSDRTIATMANVSPTTVGSVRRELGSNVQVGHKDRVEKSGRKARGRKPGSGKPKSTTAKGPSVHPSARGVSRYRPPPKNSPVTFLKARLRSKIQTNKWRLRKRGHNLLQRQIRSRRLGWPPTTSRDWNLSKITATPLLIGLQIAP